MSSPIITHGDLHMAQNQNQNRTADVTAAAPPVRPEQRDQCNQGGCGNRPVGATAAPISSSRRRTSPIHSRLFTTSLLHGSRAKEDGRLPLLQNQHVSISERGGQSRSSSETDNSSQTRRASSSSTPDIGTSPKPQSPPRSPLLARARAPVPRMVAPTQPLKKRRSIMDRFRLLSRETPNPSPKPQTRTPVIYVPTHAASDFSRITVSPRTQRTAASRGEPLETIVAIPSEDETAYPAALKRHSPVLQTLAENEPVYTIPEHPVPRTSPAKEHTRKHSASSARQPNSPSPQHSYSPVTDLREASQAMPSTAAPNARIEAIRATDDTPAQPAVKSMPGPSQQQLPNTEPREVEGPVTVEQSSQLSDYELFLARAEAKERAYRDQTLRHLSRHPNGYVVPYYDPRAEAETTLLPYRQPVTYPAKTSSTGSTAVGVDQPGALRKTWDGRITSIDSGIGSQSSRRGSRREAEEAPNRLSRHSESQPRKHTSWSPAPGLRRGDAHRNLTAPGTAAVGEVDDNCGGTTTASGSTLVADKGGPNNNDNAPQQPRTLRKQASFRQKIGEYIKPPRQPSRYDAVGNTTGLARIMERKAVGEA
ncbi:hypothetical protein QBC33DRAFT_119557 [Phialemonium atrogriseum]|uniref:Uncharacterized protein n=1 Tax=Phialemonium atrogriseum TaxID=1093897 RepID=A0AAJ0FJZ5_9PEZI|nr:uncharacterized protein QBC33DRAFT_119557 [Phialemonium atrogriseum]KAK1765868.1 hypothetical protein QBC33DRAFT_119557 [Phialemonium atrogriseum]